ncbi:calcium/calmodulin-dependent protein kinase type 1 [Aphelenchoides avenae]|nr:calcium/calmodulin-dependent protein kinase type 1 [Aphelenchus avenae]
MSRQLQLCEDPSLAGQLLPDSDVTIGHILVMLYEHNAEFRSAIRDSGRVKALTTSDLGRGRGYMSTVYRCTVTFADDTHEPFSFVAKVPSTLRMTDSVFPGTDELTKMAFLKRAHNGECEFYETFKNVDGFPTPKVWYTRKLDDDSSLPALILMEDLSDRGATLSIADSVTLEQVRLGYDVGLQRKFQSKNVARHVAALHAHILCSDTETQQSAGFAFHMEMDIETTFKTAARELNELDPDFNNMIEKLEPIANSSFNAYALVERPRAIGLPLLLCHGDMWVNNIVFEKAPDGTTSDRILAIIDWQTTLYGNPMLDLALFISSSADAEVRREAEKDDFIVKHYHTELERRMALAAKVPPYDVKQVRKD